MLEAELSEEVESMLFEAGAFGVHHPDSRRMQGHAGFPDWVVTGKAALQFWELKTEEGKLSPDQKTWARLIRRHGGTYLVLRPSDLQSGLIKAQINAVTGGI